MWRRPAFAFVARDDVRLDANAACDHPRQRFGVAAQQSEHVALEICEQFRIGDDAVLHYFVEA